jgi:hypothetical protein
VILQNEAFDYALKAAPGILHQRNKEFGQVRSSVKLIFPQTPEPKTQGVIDSLEF